jgi:Tol biopolymer transport system component
MVAGLAAAILAGAGAMWLLRPAEPRVARAVRFTIELPIARQLGSMSLAPDGGKLAYVGTEASQSRIFVHRFDTGLDEPIAGTEGARAPFFSPDGSQVGFFLRNDLMSVRLEGGRPTTIWRLPPVQFADRVNAALWLDDGTIVCSAGAAGLWRVPVSGQHARLVAYLDPAHGELNFGRPTLVPGQQHVLVPVAGGAALDPVPITLLSLNTGERRLLVADGDAPHYLPTGQLAYLARGGLVATAFDSARMTLTGSSVPVIDSVSRYAVSARGDLAYTLAASGEPSTLVRLDRKGVTVKVANLPPGTWGSVSLAPDGRRVAMHQSLGRVATLWTTDVDRGDLTLIGREGNPHAAVWSPDGQRIVFSAYRDRQISNLFLQNADGTGQPTPLVRSRLHGDPGSWSKDARWLAYTESSRETGYDLWTLDTRSGGAVVFRQTQANESMPRISPDGAWLAYQSNDTGRSEIYVEAFPAGGRRTKISLDGGSEPLWCDADRTLLYRSRDRLMSVRVGTQGGSPVPEAPAVVLEGSFVRAQTFGPSAYAVSPDGRYFYFVQQAASPPAPATIHVVLGWLEEFKRRLK